MPQWNLGQKFFSFMKIHLKMSSANVGRLFLLQYVEAETNGHHFPDDIFKCIFLNENVLISIDISLKFVAEVSINNIPALVQIMAWRRPREKPLSEPMTVSLLTHICVTRPQWVNTLWPSNVIWQCRFGSTLDRVVVCFLPTTNYLANKRWLITQRFCDIHLRGI